MKIRFWSTGLAILCVLSYLMPRSLAQKTETFPGHWPQEYSVRRSTDEGTLTLSTPYYTTIHDLKRGGAIAEIQYTYGRVQNLLKQPVGTTIQLEAADLYSDIHDPSPSASHQHSGQSEMVKVEARLLTADGKDSAARVTTLYEYRWGYIKIRKEFHFPDRVIRVKRLSVFSSTLDPSLSDCGYRQGIAAQEGANPFGFGICQWSKIRSGTHFDPPLRTRFVPRYLALVNHGIEGIEWFVGSDLSQWDYQATGSPGNGQCYVGSSMDPHGVSVSIDPIHLVRGSAEVKGNLVFEYYVGMPILEGHANRTWLHRAFNRNQGRWVSEDTLRNWAELGLKTIHCHNDGDAHDDGLFWRDGSYPPYPPEDMRKYDEVIALCHKYGIRVATYFSNKELHPITDAFKQHGELWGRKPDDQGKLRHNYHRSDEFGAQMCLKSGWADHLKFTIDRVLKNHDLDGVYYDWNIALYCNNPLHVGQSSNQVSGERGFGALALSPTGHWDMDELIEFMEWTRQRVGPDGLVILHNTMAPMFVTENFADYVVGMEWGYGKLLTGVPPVSELPPEWNFAGARSRGVIGYGTIDSDAPRFLHRLLALETLLTGVTPWPATEEAFDLYRILRPLGNIERFGFEDYRNQAVSLDSSDCSSAVYSRPEESFVLIGNLSREELKLSCELDPEKLKWPIKDISSAKLLRKDQWEAIPEADLTGEGVALTIPAGEAILLHVESE